MIFLLILSILLVVCLSLQAPASQIIKRYYQCPTSLRTGRHVLKTCETYCPDPNQPRAHSLTDSDPLSLLVYPPLIHHIRSTNVFSTLTDLIAHETGLPRKYIRELLDFGAVYLSVPSGSLASSKKLSSGKNIKTTKVNGNLLLQLRKSQDDDLTPSMTSVSRVMKADTSVPAGSYCRVHVNPRRCKDAVNGIMWRDRLIHSSSNPSVRSSSSVIFVDKIPGVPVSATVDNICENMVNQVQLLLPLNSPPLHLASRLDVCTSGIVPLAKDKASAAVLSKAITEKKLDKIYTALCRREIPLGTLKHCFRKKSKSHDNAKPTLLRAYDASLLELKADHSSDELQVKASMSIGPNAGKQSRRHGNGNDVVDMDRIMDSRPTKPHYTGSRSGNQIGSVWQLAELEVLSCRQVFAEQLSEAVTQHISDTSPSGHSSSGNRSGSSNGSNNSVSGCFYECEIRLVTGRTHQIRLQLAAIGASIVGDTRYNPVEGLLDSGEELDEKSKEHSSQTKELKSKVNAPESKQPVGDGEHLMGPEPKRIGLQCSRLFFPSDVSRSLNLTDNAEIEDLSVKEATQKGKGSILYLKEYPIRFEGTASEGGVLVTAGRPWWRLFL